MNATPSSFPPSCQTGCQTTPMSEAATDLRCNERLGASPGGLNLERLKTVALAGNPNVGKSVVFHSLTGEYANVSNFPGTTVGVMQTHWFEGITLADTPGVHGLSGLSEEERIAETSLMAADVVVNVVSAVSLQRDLFLTQQLIDWGCKLLLLVNQLDEAEAQGIQIDLARLETLLGVPVIGCVATKNKGLERVRQRLSEARSGNKTPDWPSNNEQARQLEQEPSQRLKLYGLRRQHCNTVIKQVVRHPHTQSGPVTLSLRLGQWLLHPVMGAVALLAVLLALYQVIGVWVAGDLVDLLEGQLLLGYVIPWIQQNLALTLPPENWLFRLLAGEFGLVTMSIQYIIGVLFPLVGGFYLYLSILEDCGYLPRLAVLADGLLSRLGLNGRAMIPIILGLGCVTMATISTRVLTSQRERTIANVLLGITIPCSAQLGVIMGMAAIAGGFNAWLVFIAILFSLFIAIGTVLNKILPGKSTALVMDLPPLRLPQPRNVAKKTWSRTWGFLAEAAPLFVLGAALVSVSQITGLLDWLETSLAPLTEGMLHLPGEAASAFVMGMVRRDFGLAGFNLLKESLSATQILTSLVVITLFVPCIASATVMWKERGWLEGAGVLTASWVLAFSVGAVVTRVLETLGWFA